MSAVFAAGTLYLAFGHAPAPSAPPAAPPVAAPASQDRVPQRFVADVVWNRAEGYERKTVALTFDDGPHPAVTPRVLDILDAHGVKATFFVLGCQARQCPELVRRIADAGHALGNHSDTHISNPGPGRARTEIDACQQAIEDASGVRVGLFRPPGGDTDSAYTDIARKRGFCIVGWTVDTRDWASDQEGVYRAATGAARPGDIILLHDAGGGSDTVDALPRIIAKLRADGFEFVTVPDMLRDWDGCATSRERCAAHASRSSGGA